MNTTIKNIQILKWLTPGDKILISILLGIGLLSFGGLNLLDRGGSTATVWADGKKFASLDLNQEQELSVGGPLGETKIIVERGYICISESPCVHKICVKMGKIHRAPQMLVCLPNRIIIKIESSPKSHSFDVITE